MAHERANGGRGTRLVGIEGLRAVAASTILVYHVWLYAAPGGVSVDFGPLTNVFDNLRAGVTLFFALSGFLLFRPYVAAALRGTASPALGRYLRNRALRILPAYWFILLVVALALEHSLLRNPGTLAANLFFAQNYRTGTIFTGVVPAWSLAIEIVFYVCVPILGGLAIALARRRVRARYPVGLAFVPVAAMVTIGFATKAAIRIFDLGHVWQLTFLAHADWFAAGMAVAVLRVEWEDGRLHLPRWWRPAAAVVACVVSVGGMLLYYEGVLSYLEYQSPIALGCGLLLALVVFAEPGSRMLTVLEWRPLAALGLASYSLFLWHDPLLRSFRDRGWSHAGVKGFVFNLVVIAVVSVALSAASYLFVEKPALLRKKSWQRGGAEARPAAAAGAPEGELRSPTAPSAAPWAGAPDPAVARD